MSELLEDKKAWNGGYFDLVIRLGNIPESSASAFADGFWEYPLLDRHGETETGIATLPPGKSVCRASVFRWYDEIWEASFGFPMGGLDRLYPTGLYPFEDGSAHGWIVPVSDWLVGLARHRFEVFPFYIAVIGFEAELPEEYGPVEVPLDVRWDGYLKRSGHRLEWFPPTTTNAPMTIEP